MECKMEDFFKCTELGLYFPAGSVITSSNSYLLLLLHQNMVTVCFSAHSGLLFKDCRVQVLRSWHHRLSIISHGVNKPKLDVGYSRVPSKRVAMVSRKVFWGAIRPRITGIRERVEPRLSRRSDPWLSPAVATKPGRNLDVAPGAPPSPWRRAPSRDTRDSTVRLRTPTTVRGDHACEKVGGAARWFGGRRLEKTPARTAVTFTHGCAAILLPLPTPPLSLCSTPLLSPFHLSLRCFSISPFSPLEF